MNFLEIVGLMFCGIFAISVLVAIISYLTTIGKKPIDGHAFKKLANSKKWTVVVPDDNEIAGGVSGLRADAGNCYIYHLSGDAQTIRRAYDEIKNELYNHMQEHGSMSNSVSFNHYSRYSISDDVMYAVVVKLGDTIMCTKAHPSAKNTVKEFFRLSKY